MKEASMGRKQRSPRKEKMKYVDFDIEDFVTDEFFIQWVKNPSEETNHFWLKWIAGNPEKKHTIQKAREIISLVDYEKRFELSDQAYMDLFEDIVEKSHQALPKKNIFQWRGWHKSAAILFLAFSSIYTLYFFNSVNEEIEQTEHAITWVTFDNPAGQKYKFKLPDGTIVHLNSESSIEYPEKFDSVSRVVRMKGEAFFDVSRDTLRPFIIETKTHDVRVLGTSFNLKNGENFELALVEGKVQVEGVAGDTITLFPNEMLIKDNQGRVTKTSFDPLEVLGWKDQYLVFNDNSFEQVVNKLESWFGVKIVSELTLESNWSYSGRYHNKSLNHVLDGISISSEFKYVIDHKTVTISNL